MICIDVQSWYFLLKHVSKVMHKHLFRNCSTCVFTPNDATICRIQQLSACVTCCGPCLNRLLTDRCYQFTPFNLLFIPCAALIPYN